LHTLCSNIGPANEVHGDVDDFRVNKYYTVKN